MADYTKDSTDNPMVGTTRADTLRNDGNEDDPRDHYTIQGLAGNDYIYNTGDYAAIDAGAGNDTVFNKPYDSNPKNGRLSYLGGNHSTIHGGAGNDYIDNSFSTLVALYGDDGNDYIVNDALKTTINGGKGNDTIDIDGGTISGEVIGGWVRNPSGDNYSVTGNEININGAADLIDAYLIGGLVGTGDGRSYSPSGNTLNVNATGITARSINGF